MMNWMRGVFLGVLGLSSLLCPVQSAAQVPQLIRYQGQALDRQGVPLEGPYRLTFRLYGADTAGTPLWEERHDGVLLSKGYFSVLLGQMTPFTDMRWDQPCWLSVQLNDEPELAPRQQMTSVPLAIRALAAEQLTVPLTTSTMLDDANRLVPSNAVILWTGTTCPAGYSRLSALDGKFLVADSAYNAEAGGSDSITPTGSISNESGHTHSFSATTSAGDNVTGGKGQIDNQSNLHPHTHTISGATGGGSPHTHPFTGTPFDNRPEFATLLLCQKD